MDMVEIVFDEEGRLIRPKGVRLRIPADFVVPTEPDETEEAREARFKKFWDETDAILNESPLKPWPVGDPIVDKYRRKGLID